MTNYNSTFSLVLGRCLIGVLFLVSGLFKIGRFAGVAGFMRSKGLPAAEILLVLTIVLEVGAGLALMVGWGVRYCAWALLAFTGLATVMFHPFWVADTTAYQNQLNHFLKNIAIMGGLLRLCAAGAEALGLDKGVQSK